MKNAFNISLKAIKVAGIEFAGNIEIAASQVDDQCHTEINLGVNKVKTENVDLEMDLQMSFSSDFTEGELIQSIDSFIGRITNQSDSLTSIKDLEDKYSTGLPNLRKVAEDPSQLVEALSDMFSPIFEMFSESEDIDLILDGREESESNESNNDSEESFENPHVIVVTVNPGTDTESKMELGSVSPAMHDIMYHTRYSMQAPNVKQIRIQWVDGSQVTLIKTSSIYSKWGKKGRCRVGNEFIYCRIDSNENGLIGPYSVGQYIEMDKH